MKWPQSIMLIRHIESEYNRLKKQKTADPQYQDFVREYEKSPESTSTVFLAERIAKKYALNVSDARTPVAPGAEQQAIKTGEHLRKKFNLPHVIYVSPYDRTLKTLEYLIEGWPELGNVKVYEDEEIREREHGLVTLYNDWRVFFALHPEQRRFYEQDGPYRYRYPQGESIPDMRARAKRHTATLIREHSGERVMVICHHETLLSFRANWERWTEEEYLKVDAGRTNNCGVTLYKGCPTQGKNGKLVLVSYNEKHY